MELTDEMRYAVAMLDAAANDAGWALIEGVGERWLDLYSDVRYYLIVGAGAGRAAAVSRDDEGYKVDHVYGD